MQTIYKSEASKKRILELYNNKQQSLGIDCSDIFVDTFAGKTHVLVCGPEHGEPILLLHGINAGAPLALEAMKGLHTTYRIYAVDTIGQAGKSAETRLPLEDLSLSKWLAATMDGLGLSDAIVVGVSYGAFLLQKLMQYAPERITKAIFVVPSGFTNGSASKAFFKVSLPLFRFYLMPSDKNMIKFMDAFYTEKDTHSIDFQKTVLTGVKMDFRRPPLLKAEQVRQFNKPVYGIFAGNDVFFPGDVSLEKCRTYFSNFRDYITLSHSKHIPDTSDYPAIVAAIGQWISDRNH